MHCHYHPGTQAVGKCAGCQKPLCAVCAGGQPAAAPLCHTCQALAAVHEMNRDREARQQRATGMAERKKRKKRLWIALGWVAVLVCAGIVLIRIPELTRAFRPESPIRRGAYATDAGTDACIRNLWRQSALLRQGKPPDPALVCPVSQRAYRVMANDGNTIVMCPEPGRHGLRELQVEKNRPAPRVRK